MEFKPTHISVQDRNRLASWSKRHRAEFAVSPAGHMVEIAFTALKRRMQWWVDSERVVLDGKTKKALKAGSAVEVINIMETVWGPS